MGTSEMNCPCYRRTIVEERKKENDVIDLYYSKRFGKEHLLYSKYQSDLLRLLYM